MLITSLRSFLSSLARCKICLLWGTNEGGIGIIGFQRRFVDPYGMLLHSSLVQWCIHMWQVKFLSNLSTSMLCYLLLQELPQRFQYRLTCESSLEVVTSPHFFTSSSLKMWIFVTHQPYGGGYLNFFITWVEKHDSSPTST